MTADDSESGPPILARADMLVAVLSLHVATEWGCCAGCLDAWARLAPAPCAVARSAHELLALADPGTDDTVSASPVGPIEHP